MNRFPIAVTGVGLLCAAGSDTDAVWSTILSGTSAIQRVTRPGFERYPEAVAGQIDEAWLEKDFSDEDLVRYSRDSRAAILAAREAVTRSGIRLPADRSRVGVALGKCQALSRGGDLIHSWIHATADGICHALEFHGPRITISTACAAGGNAIGTAQDKLWSGEADVMLAGGVDLLDPSTYAGFNALRALDVQACAPYSRSGGLSLGEGAAFLVLEPLDAALARGAQVLAEVLGYGLSADAHHATAPDPTGRGAVLAGHRALAEAELDVDAITYVNGHGTGTPANDSTERRVMRGLFGDRAAEVPITGTKSFTGHTLGAAGAVEAAVTVLSIQHGMIPPTVNFDHTKAPDLDFVPDTARQAQVDVVLSNNYAFGGNNVSVVLGRHDPKRRLRGTPQPDQVHITGVGLWGRAGLGLDDWIARLVGSAKPLDETQMLAALNLQPFAAASAWRHMNVFTKASMAACRLAMEDSRVTLDRDTRDGLAVLSGTMSGPAASQYDISDSRTPGTPSAHEFAQIVLNAPAGAVCQALGLRGPTTTIVSGGTSGTLALQTAVEFIQLGRSDCVLVFATEEAGPTARGIYDNLNRDSALLGCDSPALPLGEHLSSASVAVLVESGRRLARDGARKAYCTVESVAHASDSFHPYRHRPDGASLRRAVDQACSGKVRGVDVVVGVAAEDDSLSRAHRAGTAHLDAVHVEPKRWTGECEAASGLGNVALAAALVAGRAELAVGSTFRTALATSASFGASYGAVRLQACEDSR